MMRAGEDDSKPRPTLAFSQIEHAGLSGDARGAEGLDFAVSGRRYPENPWARPQAPQCSGKMAKDGR